MVFTLHTNSRHRPIFAQVTCGILVIQTQSISCVENSANIQLHIAILLLIYEVLQSGGNSVLCFSDSFIPSHDTRCKDVTQHDVGMPTLVSCTVSADNEKMGLQTSI